MKEPKITNHIDISGVDVQFDTLPEEKRRQIVEVIQDTIMSTAGYKRKPA